jgi:beta-ribofuranosylaminobenzene 5'-phosphate synthase
LGRQFGSLGLTLKGLGVRVSAEPADQFSVAGPQSTRVERLAQTMRRHYGLGNGFRLVTSEVIPEHIGLGSGTQLALATGMAISHLFGLSLSVREIATVLDRGGRSGIGVGAFESGGFLLDGGRAPEGPVPPITARLSFPAHWRVLLIFDERGQEGVHGDQEVAAFRALPAFSEASAANLCRLAIMQVLPGLAERDFARFGSGIGAIQRIVGDHFAPAQGGRFTSGTVTAVLEWLAARGIEGVGQSSWGPTGFAVVESETQAHALIREAQLRWDVDSRLRFVVLSGQNTGAELESAGCALSFVQQEAAEGH